MRPRHTLGRRKRIDLPGPSVNCRWSDPTRPLRIQWGLQQARWEEKHLQSGFTEDDDPIVDEFQRQNASMLSAVSDSESTELCTA